jgi:3-isopropylmalate dehydratase small subunit
MKATITTIFPNNINTDDIIRADVLQEYWDKPAFAKFAFEKFDPEFIQRCATKDANVSIAGSNVGCGSSREQAVYSLQYNNVKFVITHIDPTTNEAYPDIFYRNSIMNGLPLIALEDISSFSINDEIELNLEKQEVINLTKNLTFKFNLSQTDLDLLNSGGLIGRAKDDIQKRIA